MCGTMKRAPLYTTNRLTCYFGADWNVIVHRRRVGRRPGNVLDPLDQVVGVVREVEHVRQDADPGRSQLLGVGSLSKYREVKLDFTPEIEVFYMLFERCPTKNTRKRYLKQHMRYFNFRGKIQLDHPVSCHLDSGPLFRVPKLSPVCLSYQLLG